MCEPKAGSLILKKESIHPAIKSSEPNTGSSFLLTKSNEPSQGLPLFVTKIYEPRADSLLLMK